MTAKLRLPSNLSSQCDAKRLIETEHGDVSRVLQDAAAEFPKLETHLWAADGTLHRHVNIFVNDQNIRDLNHLQTAVVDGDEVLIVPAIAGG